MPAESIVRDVMSVRNNTRLDPGEQISSDDAAWVLGNTFMILTMQSGFGLLEAGFVSTKNVANIMVKNVIDVTLGGIVYWSCGYALSFSTAATTIVSGAVAERMKLSAYSLFSMLNVFIYCLPACWCWNPTGFLYKMGFFDFAGACVVHLTGGASALVAAIILGPRLGRFSHKDDYAMSSPVTALTGTFMLWWAWLSFNCGSTFGVDGRLWKDAAQVAVTTLNGSIGGGIASMILSVIVFKGCFDIPYMITGILAGLVAVTAGCAVISPHEAILIGAIGALLSIGATVLIEKLKIDDPVGASPVHLVCGAWSTIAVGLFAQYNEDPDYLLPQGYCGLLHGCGFKLLGVQTLGVVILCTWSMITTVIVFMGLKYTIGIRMHANEEILGADWVEHRVRSTNLAEKLEAALKHIEVDEANIKEAIVKVMSEHGHDKKRRELRKKWRQAVVKSMPKPEVDDHGSTVDKPRHRLFATKSSGKSVMDHPNSANQPDIVASSFRSAKKIRPTSDE